MQTILPAVDPNDSALIDFLEKIPLFDQFARDEFELFIRVLVRKQYQPGDVVFNENSQEKILFIVEKGLLSLTILGDKEKDFKRKAVFGEIAIIDNNTRTGTVTTVQESILLCANGDDLFDENKFDIKTSFKLFRALTCQVTSYLRSSLQTKTRTLIQGGESMHVEFKSRLRFKNDEEGSTRPKFEVVKTIVAFLNSNGGTLLVGVDKDKMPIGIDDNFEKEKQDEDIKQWLAQVLASKIPESAYVGLIHLKVEKIDDKRILRVDCKPSPAPVWLEDWSDDGKKKKGEDQLFIRDESTTKALPCRRAYEYITSHFTHSLS
ncbi:MAG: RNA-binding domain-containing protein [candidate division KSB1 bacterium]